MVVKWMKKEENMGKNIFVESSIDMDEFTVYKRNYACCMNVWVYKNIKLCLLRIVLCYDV